MQQAFTPNLLVKYLYNECTDREIQLTNDAFDADPLIWSQYRELWQAYRQMPKARFSASNNSLSNVLDYSICSACENGI